MAEVDQSYDLNKSVDEIFSEYSINQIKSLSNEYQVKTDSAKSDLHNLVGLKYRDLIRIAESIQDMYELGNDVDQSLSNLCYKSSNFINFSANPLSKYNSSIRKNQLIDTQTRSKKTILTNLITNTLIKIDLKLALTIHTLEFVKYSKIYYTIEDKFHDILQENSHLNSTYINLKNKFNLHLTTNLSNYNILSLQPNDLIRINQGFTIRDLSKNPHEFDIFDDDEFVENDDDSSYYSSTYPIINYLLSYMVLNNFSVSTTIEKFIQLRYDYLQAVLLEVDSNKTVNFLPLLKYLQNTREYITLLIDSQSEFYQNLLTIKPWKSSVIIGYRYWLHDDLVKFDTDKLLLPQTNIDSKLSGIISYTYEFIYNLMQSSQSQFASISYPITLFSRFITDLKTLEEYLESNDKQFLILENLNNSNLLTGFCHKTFEIVNANFQTFFKNKFNLGTQSLESLSHKQTIQLFSDELFDIMDSNMDQYISSIAQYTQSSDTSGFIREWFNYYTEFSKCLPKSNLDNSIKKLSNQQISWGTFSGDLISQSFEKLDKESDVFFWKNIDEFVKLIQLKLSEKLELKSVYNYLDVLISTKSGSEKVTTVESLSVILNECIEKCFSLIFEAIPIEVEQGYFDRLSNVTTEEFPTSPSFMITSTLLELSRRYLSANNESRDFQYGKLFIDVNSKSTFEGLKNEMIEKFVNQFINSSQAYLTQGLNSNEDNGKDDHEMTEETESGRTNKEKTGTVIEDDKIEDKTDVVIEGDKIEDKVDVQGEVKTGSKGEANTTSPPDANQIAFARSIFVDAVFVLQFMSGTINSRHPQIVQLLEKINNQQTLIDKTATNIILKTIGDFFNSSRGIYLPLLLS